MPSNTEARLRQYLTGGGQRHQDPYTRPENLPAWLRDQWTFQTAGSEGGDGRNTWGAPGSSLRDSQGRLVALLNDDGTFSGNDTDWNEGAEGNRRFDPDLGWVTDHENTNEERFKERMRRNRAIALSIVAGAGLAGGLAAGAGAAGAGAEGAAAGSGAFDASAMGSGLSSAGATTGGTFGGSVGAGGVMEGMGAAGAAGSGGGLAGLGQAATIPGDLALNTAGAGAGTSLVEMPAIQAAAGGSGGMGSIYQGLGGAQGIARLGAGLAGLGAASSGGGASGGETDPQNIIEQMANANRVNHNTPIGSRNWVQDPATGRWTVNDTMSPAEAENFGQVQGMNADVTGMGRARLAALLAAPPRPRYDRPLGS